MLRDHEFEAFLIGSSLAGDACLLMRRARERGAGVEIARRGPGSAIVRVHSRKMGGCVIPAKSRTLHASAVKWHEYDPVVLEYYADPHTFTVDTRDETGRTLNRTQHTVDFLVLEDVLCGKRDSAGCDARDLRFAKGVYGGFSEYAVEK